MTNTPIPATLVRRADALCSMHRECLLTALLEMIDSPYTREADAFAFRSTVERWITRCGWGTTCGGNR